MTIDLEQVNQILATKLMGWTRCDCCSNYWTEVDADGDPTTTAILIVDWNPVQRLDHAQMVQDRLAAKGLPVVQNDRPVVICAAALKTLNLAT